MDVVFMFACVVQMLMKTKPDIKSKLVGDLNQYHPEKW